MGFFYALWFMGLGVRVCKDSVGGGIVEGWRLSGSQTCFPFLGDQYMNPRRVFIVHITLPGNIVVEMTQFQGSFGPGFAFQGPTSQSHNHTLGDEMKPKIGVIYPILL